MAVDACVYTPLLNRRGTYEADLTVTRVAADDFLLVSSSATTMRDLDWLARRARERVGAACTVEDLTDAFSVMGVMGPRSRELLGSLTDDDLSEDGFPFATSRRVTLAGAPVRATRMTYVGELGWELMVPVEHAPAVYDAVRAAGAPLGIADAGYHAIESMRLEKGYRAFGRELTPDYTPVEAGLVFATALAADKDFLGRDALDGAPHRAGRGRLPAPVGLVRGRRPGADALGRRAAAARRGAARSGHECGLGRDRRRPASGSPTSATTARCGRTGWTAGASRPTWPACGTAYACRCARRCRGLNGLLPPPVGRRSRRPDDPT